MLIGKQNGYEFHVPTSGGKAGKGRQRTSTVQVRCGNVIVKQFRFDVTSTASRQNAVLKAKAYAQENKL